MKQKLTRQEVVLALKKAGFISSKRDCYAGVRQTYRLEDIEFSITIEYNPIIVRSAKELDALIKRILMKLHKECLMHEFSPFCKGLINPSKYTKQDMINDMLNLIKE